MWCRVYNGWCRLCVAGVVVFVEVCNAGCIAACALVCKISCLTGRVAERVAGCVAEWCRVLQ